MNPDPLAAFAENTWSVTRQLHYSTSNSNSLDLVLLLNGLPLVTAELKNPLSGQTVQHAIKQYKEDRDANELIFTFKKRSLVHFALDQDAVFMTTRLSGNKTFFLPFNLGNQHHAGNPQAADGGYRTAYLWREVWQRDSLLDIVGRFMHLQVSEKRILTSSGIKTITIETMIFPRYHQLDCVRKMDNSAREHGPGKNYLIQHSAGSGKSNSIAWLAHSSQSGESAMELKGILNAEQISEDAAAYATEHGLDDEDAADHLAGVVREMMKRGKQPNLSFFAFTATPKYKTKIVFDEPGENGQSPFHLYTMRQAIEERFILDVLKNYTTFETYFRIVQASEDDPNVLRKKASRALARALSLHEYIKLR